MTQTIPQTESHPLEPFLPEHAHVLLLGSFPPQSHRWSMNFFYPNFQNDMWRIMGLIFFNNKDQFVDNVHKSFKEKDVIDFCNHKGFAIFDTATSIKRLKDNASDKFLEVVEPTDIKALLDKIPECKAIITTGEKATETLAGLFSCAMPKISEYTELTYNDRVIRLYRMPSSSRAYPLALAKKAEIYGNMLKELGY